MDWIYSVPALRLLLGLLFIVTAFLKISNVKGFALIVQAYGILPRGLSRPLAYVQPFVELLVGCWILSGRFLFGAALAGLALMFVATAFVVIALIKKRRMDNCGCYGVAFKVPLSWNKVVENCVWMLLLALLAYIMYGAY